MPRGSPLEEYVIDLEAGRPPLFGGAEVSEEPRGLFRNSTMWDSRATPWDAFDFSAIPAEDRWALHEGARRFQATGAVDQELGALMARYHLRPPEMGR